MLQSQIAEAFVKIGAKGFESVKAQYAALTTATAKAQAQLNKTAAACNVVGQAARTQFNSASNAMLRFAAAASPGDALKLDAAIGRLTVQIGSLFLPVIRGATDWINKLTARLRELTPEQREHIGNFAKLGLVIAGVVGVGSQLLNFLPGLIGGLGAVRTAVTSLIALLGVGGAALTGWGAVILAVVGALGALGAASVLAAGKGEAVGKSFQKVWDGIKKLAESVWNFVKPVLAVIGNLVAGVIGRIADVAAGVIGTVAKFLDKVSGSAGGMLAVIEPILNKINSIADRVFSRVVGFVTRAAELAASVWDAVFEVVGQLSEEFQGLADDIMNVVYDVMETVEELANQIMDALEPVVEFFYKSLKDAIQSLGPVIKSVLGTMVQFLRDAIKEMRIMARVLQAIATNPLDALDLEGVYKAARDDVEADDARRKEEREAERNKPKPEKEQKTTSGRANPTGVQSIYKPELSSISDVLRKAQTAALGESKEMAMNRERIELQKQGNQAQRETRDAVKDLQIGLR